MMLLLHFEAGKKPPASFLIASLSIWPYPVGVDPLALRTSHLEDDSMSRTFTDAVAESREAFLDLVGGAHATYYEVYSGTPNSELEGLFDTGDQGERFLRFDVEKHSGEARDRFCRMSDIERRSYDLPSSIDERPIPYFGAFVPGIGYTGIAWTGNEIRELIARTRKDVGCMKDLAEQLGKKFWIN